MDKSLQSDLIHQISTWMHFIGGYYKNEKKFISEARKFGISRRAPAQLVGAMEFGDRIVFLRYMREGSVFAFAEGHIVGVTFEGGLAKQVGDQLIDDGKANYSEGGGMVQRECGSYMVMGTYLVTATLQETMQIAKSIHDKSDSDEPLFVMVNAKLTRAFKQVVYLSPAPKFTRGFIRSDDSSFVAPGDFEPERTVIAIDGYAKKDRKSSLVEYPLLPEG